MLQSLRARLAFLFAGTLVLATVIAAVVVVSLYRTYNRDQTVNQLRNQVGALASYYQKAFNKNTKGGGVPVNADVFSSDRRRPGVLRRAAALPEAATVDQERGHQDPDRPARRQIAPHVSVPSKGRHTDVHRGRSADLLNHQPVGAVVLARPLADVNNAWKNVIGLVGVGLAVGLAVALILATYVARRITYPAARDRKRGRQGRPRRPRRERGRQAQRRRRAGPARHPVPGHGRSPARGR